MNASQQTLARWRLILGRYAQDRLPGSLSPTAARIEQALDYLYAREYKGRGVRQDKGAGSLDPSQLNVPQWLGEVRALFPRDVVERIEKHALDRYGMTELVTDKQVLEKLQPSMDLLKAILTFRGHMREDVLHEARRIVRHVVEKIRLKLEADVVRTMAGKLNRFRRSPVKVAQNFDWRHTIRRNLKHFDRQRQHLVVQELQFFSRLDRRLPWHIVMCIDQSGSMASSVIHSAVMAGILSRLPMIRARLVVFDTAVVDLSEHVDDPVEVLMSVQLGGGTDIGQAMAYCEGLVQDPRRTIVILVSDFCEGAAPGRLLGVCRRLREAGVKLLGLAALDAEAAPSHDLKMAERLADEGMDIAALTPNRLAEWLARAIQ